MTEKYIQTQIIKQLRARGWYVIKLMRTNIVGIPDLIAIYKGVAMFIEVKTAKGVVSPIQKYVISQLRKQGIRVLIMRGKFN